MKLQKLGDKIMKLFNKKTTSILSGILALSIITSTAINNITSHADEIENEYKSIQRDTKKRDFNEISFFIVNCFYLAIVTTNVANEMSVPIVLKPSVKAGGMVHEERAFDSLGLTYI